MAEDVLHNRTTIALLEKLGLSRNEVKCYLASLTLGSAQISEVAKRAGVHRVNAYSAINTLVERGLLEQEMAVRGRRIHPTSLERLQELAREHQKRATKLRWKIEDLSVGLLNVDSKSTDRPKLLFFESGSDTWRTLYERSLQAMPGSEILFIGAYPSYVAGQYDNEWFIPERLKRNISARCLNHRMPAIERLAKLDSQEKRVSRFLPAEIDFPATILVYNSEVSIFWESGKGKTAGVVIQGQALVGVMRALFELAWQMAGKAKRDRAIKR